MINIQKCAIIGCGFVGSSIAYTLMQDGLFSEMALIDVNREKAESEAMDLNHGLPYAQPMSVYAADYSDLSDCYLVIITAGTGQRAGETRLDLVHRNVEIYKDIIPKITKYNKECIILVVSNPVDILTYAALKLSGFPPNRVIGSGTVLDSARFKYLLGQHLGVDSRSVHAFIVGEHGDSELAVWSSANVSGIELDYFCKNCGKCDEKKNIYSIYDEVKNSAYKVIEGKGATYYAVAMAVNRIAECIVRNELSVLPVSGLIDDHYGINDVCMGLPSIVGSEGISKILEIPLNESEQRYLYESADKLKAVIKDIKL